MIGSSEPEPGAEVVRLLLRCHQIGKELATSAGLSVDEFYCLTQLYFRAPCCVKTLRELLGVSPTRASRLLHDLELRGYLTRSLAIDDKRREQLTLTSKGLATARGLLQSSAFSSRRLFSALPDHLRPLQTVRRNSGDPRGGSGSDDSVRYR
jgi:DNA-binding MarR family transcriptional regulator